MYNAAFWKAAAERAAKTFLQTYFAVALAGDAVLNVFQFTWLGPELGIALGGALLSLVTSGISALGGNAGPSLANEVALNTDANRPTPNNPANPNGGLV